MEKKGSEKFSKNKVFKFAMLLVGEAALFLFLFLFPLWHFEMSLWIWDSISACIVFGGLFIILLFTGLLPDFLRAFVYDLKEPETIEPAKLKKSALSVKISMKAVLALQLFDLVCSYAATMAGLFDLEEIKNLAILCLGRCASHAICGTLAVLALLPVYARLKIMLIEQDMADSSSSQPVGS